MRTAWPKVFRNLGTCEVDPIRQIEIHLRQFTIDQANGDVEGMATALQFKGWSEFILAEYTSARDAFSISREGYLQVGNLPMAAYMSSLMTIAYQFLGDQESATLHLEEALAEFREITLENHDPWCLLLKSMIALERGRYAQVVEVSEEIGRIAQRMSDLWPVNRSSLLACPPGPPAWGCGSRTAVCARGTEHRE